MAPLTFSPTHKTRLYVGSLPYQANIYDILALFTSHNFRIAIDEITFSTDPMTGRNPGYCFVNLSNPQDAAAAVSARTGQSVMGRPIKVGYDYGKRDRKPTKYHIGQFGHQEDNESDSTETGWLEADYTPTFDRWDRQDAADSFTAPVLEERRLCIGNLPRIEPHAAFDATIQQIFSGFHLQAVHKIIPPHIDKKKLPDNHYYSYVDLAKGEAESAVQKPDGTRGPWGGLLRVQKARVNPARKVMREQFDRE